MEREELFRTLFESSADAIFIEDDRGYVLDCNPAAAVLHRVGRDLLVGKHISELVPPEHRAEVIARSPESPHEFESVRLTSDGICIPVSIRTSRIEYNSLPALLLNVRDITDRKRLEQTLRASHDELELRVESRTADLAHANEVLREEILERNRAEEESRRLAEQMHGAREMEAIGRLAGGVAHDFNNLLTVIIGRCEVMLDRLSSNHPMLPDVLLIHDAAQKAASVTRQLLAFGRKQVLQPKIIDLNAAISDMKTMLMSLIRENIQLRITLQPNIRRIQADKGQLEQVIMNLVVNAIDAMANGGDLEIRTANVELEAGSIGLDFPGEAGSYAMFSVKDTGHGMNADTLEHVFEPFFTTKDAAKGTGLGLSTVYGIVKQTGGYITAGSTPGNGALFTVYFPGLDRPAEALANEIARAARGTETVLIAEDAHLVRKLTRELLEVRGYRVIEAASGEEALRICKRHQETIHLLLSDIIMPKMTGRELADEAVHECPGIKVLLMSGYADQITRSQIFKSGFQFIAKPFTSNSLASKVREVLDN